MKNFANMSKMNQSHRPWERRGKDGVGWGGVGVEGEDKMKIFANMSKMDQSYRASYGGRG